MAGAALCTVYPLFAPEVEEGKIMTVKGPIQAGKLGTTLPHEHVLVDFIGARQVSPDRYKVDEVFRIILPYLKEIKLLGCDTLIECTPAYLGRDAQLLRQLSDASGLTIMSNTGYYGAVRGKYLPPHAFTETAKQLSDRWLKEWNEGIDGTGIRPGFMKISVDTAPLVGYQRKLVEAAALTHLKSGLTIASHTGNGAAALEEIEIVQKEGVHPSAFIWVHAQNEKDKAIHEQAARRGAWVEFDGINIDNISEYTELVKSMKEAGFLKQVLISQDAGWYHVGEPGGGQYRSHATLFKEFLPALQQEGFTEADIRQLTITNPQEAFSIRVRAR